MNEEYLVDPEEQREEAPQQYAKKTYPPRTGVSKWATFKEFQAGKTITPIAFARLCGAETTAKDEFRDKDGCTMRLTFIDHDNGDMERTYENCYKDYRDDIAKARVKFNKRFYVQVVRPENRWVWTYKQLD